MKSLQKNRIIILLMPVLLCTGIFASAQIPEDEVMKSVNLLFEGMLKADSAIVRTAFFPEAKMFTSFINKKGEQVIKEEQLNDFLNAIGSKPKDAPNWNEKLLSSEIKIDDGIAQVWTKYSFFVGDKFSHCGVNAFQLMKDNTSWKIIHIMDTRRKKGCNEELTD